MKNIPLLIGICAIIIVVGFLGYKTFSHYQQELKRSGESSDQNSLSNSDGEANGQETPGGDENSQSNLIVPKAIEEQSIVMIIAFKDFRDEEYFVPRQIFRAAGAVVKTASTEKGTAIGADGGEVNVDLLVSEINPAEFDAVVFIGGPGALNYLDNEDSYKIARETIAQGKVLGAICISPAILAKAGVLEGKKATVWSSSMDKSAVKILEDNGAVYQPESVVADGKIITADGPAAADPFGMKIVEALLD